MLSRRHFLAVSSAVAAASPSRLLGRAKVQVGVCDWNLKMAAQIDAVPLAASIGFDAVEVSLGRDEQGGRLPLDNEALLASYRRSAAENKIKICSTCLDILHKHYMKNDPLGAKFTSDAIRITKALNARLILLPYFGKGALDTVESRSYVADLLKDLAKEAATAKVILALENTNSAKENAFILDRVGSDWVRVYYDVGNSTRNGYDVPEEIRWLGKERIVQVHFKDNGYLGDGPIAFEPIASALNDIDYEGVINLETRAPSGDIAKDMKRNLAFTRTLMKA